MILPDWMIRERCAPKPAGWGGDWSEPMLSPFCERTVEHGMSFGLSCAGYDVRCKQQIVLPPRGFALGSTVERFVMPNDVVAIVHDKSTWARRGLSVYNTVIESGWIGWLTIELANHGPETLFISAGDPIAQVLFHKLAAPVQAVYCGKYNNQPDEPVPARDEDAVPA